MPSVSNAWGGAAETLEMSGADFALAELARAAGRTRTADNFMKRAQWWQNNFDIAAHPSGGYIANRRADGSWLPGFTPATGNGFVEGTAAQYTWMVPQDPAGLVARMGGPRRAAARLDHFLRELNAVTHAAFPGTVVIAEESTDWPQVTRPTDMGGLGFSMKWNMGWMHDTLSYVKEDPVNRKFHHNRLTFAMMYAHTENFVLIDKDRHIRGIYNGLDKNSIQALIADIKVLEAE
jgi:hypothetical protein